MVSRNIVMPLRASNIPYGDLRHIIVVGNMEFIEWCLFTSDIHTVDKFLLKRMEIVSKYAKDLRHGWFSVKQSRPASCESESLQNMHYSISKGT